jgi:hypothetical protein
MSTMTNRRSVGPGFKSEGLSLALVYVVALVTTLALRSAPVDAWTLFVPAVAFAALGGVSLKRLPEQRPLLLGLVIAALATGVALGLA